jgi:hypothetical protein
VEWVVGHFGHNHVAKSRPNAGYPDFFMRRGRGSNSPPQLGQRPFMASEQSAQNVHSNEQMRALVLSAASAVSHRSQIDLISSAMSFLFYSPPCRRRVTPCSLRRLRMTAGT